MEMEMAEGEFPGCYRERKRSQLRRGWQQPLWFASPGCHVCWVHSAGPTLTFKTGAAAAIWLSNTLILPSGSSSVAVRAPSAASLPSALVILASLSLQTGIEAFGKNCKSLTQLKRNMPPQELERLSSTSKVNELEAMVIADTMPLLQHLQLGFGCFGDTGLAAILAKCKALTHLDVQGCWNLKLEGELEDRCLQLPAFKSPWVYDLFTDNDEQDDENDDDEYSSSDSEIEDLISFVIDGFCFFW
ncbi:hypothetical protein Goklo_009562 [Gossypium klotzschianum]|uniref:Uncharacterized protein n=1 Tax=Gossypium klotzschianum TaxID=34286 RepID=A0A7J8V482_9ROSI|nr:hypothetical protein [Gossypium klotzschianum]